MSLGIIRGVPDSARDPRADAFVDRLAEVNAAVHVFAPAAQRGSHPGVTWHHAEASTYPLFRHPPHDLAVADAIGRVAHDAGLTSLYVLQIVPHLATALLARAVTPGARLEVVLVLWPEDVEWLQADSPDARMARRLATSVDEIAVTTATDRGAVAALLDGAVPVRELDATLSAASGDMLGTD